MELLMRILTSKKAIYAMVPVIATFFVSMFGLDPTSWMMIVLDTAFGLLVVAQTTVDAIHGSPSDGTDSPEAKATRTKSARSYSK